MQKRHQQIKDILLEEKRIEVVDLSKRLGVSEVTIRKDLTELESKGVLLRRYGGAVLAENPHQVMDMLRKMTVQVKEKQAIAEAAASLISDGENILLDAGSTTLALAALIKYRNLRIVTNSLAIAAEIMQDAEATVEVIGGSLRAASGALVGPRACDNLDSLRVDKVFVGCSGFDAKLGFSSENAVEAETKRKMLECGKERIVLADHTKFIRPAFAAFATTNDIDRVITDQQLPKDASDALKTFGVQVTVTG